MSLKDRIIKSLGLRWLKGKVDNARYDSGGFMKMLDGNKRLIVVLAFVISGFVVLLTGNDVSQWIGLILGVLGWKDPGLIKAAQETATQIVPQLFAIWAAGSALWKMWQQRKAGATMAQLNSPVGVVKAAIADGSLKAVGDIALALTITDEPPKAVKVPVPVVVETPVLVVAPPALKTEVVPSTP